ncbi:MAG: hypothetical protein ACRCZZ_11105 [Phocaeicola sp.]
MKKSEFEKLKVGDVVWLRTFKEIQGLKCYDETRRAIIDDRGIVRDVLIRCFPGLLGELLTVSRVREEYIIVKRGQYYYQVHRQHLRGGGDE